MEPQAQIIWQQVSFNQANDGLGPVALGTTSGSTGRVGVRGMWTIIGENGRAWQPYVRANLWRDWGAASTATFGIDPVPLIEEATWLEFAGGVKAKLGGGVSLYAKAGISLLRIVLSSAMAFRAISVSATSGDAVNQR